MKPNTRTALTYSVFPWIILFLVRVLSSFQDIPLKEQVIVVGTMWLIVSPAVIFVGIALAYQEGQRNPK